MAQAQSDTRVLLNRIERLESDLAGVQRQLYRGETPRPAAPPSPPGAAADPMAGSVANRLSERIDVLEDQLRQLTGRMEEIGHVAGQVQARLEKIQSDIEHRLSAIERPAPGLAHAPAAAAPPGALGAPPRPTTAPPEGVLGTLRTPPGQAPGQALGQAPPGQAPPGQAIAALPAVPETPQGQYERAYASLRQGELGDAEKQFAQFLAAYPQDPLASNAQYWLGESFYGRKEYDKAAQAFLAAYQKYPKGAKAPDSLLKLAMTLSQLEQKQEACATFKQLDRDYPGAPASVLRLAASERARVGCK
jgi:tol-pal system protein YbgF